MSYRAAWCRWACTGQGASRVVGCVGRAQVKAHPGWWGVLGVHRSRRIQGGGVAHFTRAEAPHLAAIEQLCDGDACGTGREDSPASRRHHGWSTWMVCGAGRDASRSRTSHAGWYGAVVAHVYEFAPLVDVFDVVADERNRRHLVIRAGRRLQLRCASAPHTEPGWCEWRARRRRPVSRAEACATAGAGARAAARRGQRPERVRRPGWGCFASGILLQGARGPERRTAQRLAPECPCE